MAVAVASPSWQPHLDVWLLVALLSASCAVAVVRVGPRVPGRPARRSPGLQVVCFALGVLAIWVAADWPVHDIAERYNYSVHMVQHLVLSMVAAPLLLLGTPAWMLRWILRPAVAPVPAVRLFARFLPALLLFNVVLVLTHWPALVDVSLGDGLAHFLVHALVFVSALVVWMPVVSPLPEIPRLAPLPRMLFLFAQSIVPTIPASFLTFGARRSTASTRASRTSGAVDRRGPAAGRPDHEDRRRSAPVAGDRGDLLPLGGEEDRRIAARRRWQDLDRELSRMGTTTT